MRPAGLAPRRHLFVCVNRRDASSPLGVGCGDEGAALFDALKREVARRSAYGTVWITQTGCQGICPKHGATVSIYPEQRIVTEVVASDAPALIDDATRGGA